MFDKLFTPATPEEKAAKARRKAQEARDRAAFQARQAALRQERFEAMPVFTVRETRDVYVKADNMNDAIALASAAFKEGQNENGTIKWGKPFGIEGDTVDKIRTVNIQAIEE